MYQYLTSAQGRVRVYRQDSLIGTIENDPRTGKKTLHTVTHGGNKECDVTHIFHNTAELDKTIDTLLAETGVY